MVYRKSSFSTTQNDSQMQLVMLYNHKIHIAFFVLFLLIHATSALCFYQINIDIQ